MFVEDRVCEEIQFGHESSENTKLWKKAREGQYYPSLLASLGVLATTMNGPPPISISWLSGLALKCDADLQT